MHGRCEVTIEHKQEVMVTISESVMENSVVRTAFPSGDITMPWFPVCKQTLSRKRCMIDEKLLLNTN